MLTFIVPCLAGIVAGIITGLIPGIHINLVSTITLLLSVHLVEWFSYQQLVVFIISMGIIHSFIDFIPSIVFGVPNSDTALSVLPAHKLVIEGKGKEALFLSASGSLIGAFAGIPLLFLLFYILPSIIAFITPYISIILFSIVLWFIVEEKLPKKMLWPILFVSIACLYGILLLNSFHLREPLLVLFTGLFGIASLLYSLAGENNSLPPQLPATKSLPKGSLKSIVVGNCCAAICSALPGLGNAQAASIMTLFYKTTNSKIFLVITSSLNTTSFFVSIITLYLLDKARNGAIVVVSQLVEAISFEFLLQILIICYIVCCVGFVLTRILGEVILDGITRVNETYMNGVLCGILFLVVFITEGIYGVICTIGITSLGLIGLFLEVRRVHFMSILLIPVGLFLL